MHIYQSSEEQNEQKVQASGAASSSSLQAPFYRREDEVGRRAAIRLCRRSAEHDCLRRFQRWTGPSWIRSRTFQTRTDNFLFMNSYFYFSFLFHLFSAFSEILHLIQMINILEVDILEQ